MDITIDNNLEINEYKGINLKKLNIKIFQNLYEENDKLIIKNNNQNMLILLCKIDYNKELAENAYIENKIQKMAKELEKEFILKKKTEFNFKKLY